MDAERITALCAEARPDELPAMLRALPLFVFCGMPEEEADEWRLRISAFLNFHGMRDYHETTH